MTRNRLLIAAAILAAIAPALVVLFIGRSIAHRAANEQHRFAAQLALRTVEANRAACLRTSARNVLFANNFRADAIGNAAVAADPSQPALTRQARRNESDLEQWNLRVLDRQLDPRTIGTLNPDGRRIVLSLGVHAFSCDRVFPLPKGKP